MTLPTPAAGDQDPPPSGAQAPSASPDFMLQQPRATIGVRGNWVFASAGSDIYDFVTDLLTIEKSSFNTAAVGGEASWNIKPRLDVSLGLEYSNHGIDSEYRDRVEQHPDGTTTAIVQNTSLQHSNLHVSAKFALLPRGRRISQLAWIPSSFIPYVGGGAGISHYSFKQDGDFVDFADDHIYPDSYRSEGFTPSLHVFGGTDVQVYKRTFLSLEGRYMWAKAPLGPDFIGFEPIDLGGFRLSAGLYFVF
jgi:hypothetical protein